MLLSLRFGLPFRRVDLCSQLAACQPCSLVVDKTCSHHRAKPRILPVILSTVRRLRRSHYFRVSVNRVQVVLSTGISRRPMRDTGLSGCWWNAARRGKATSVNNAKRYTLPAHSTTRRVSRSCCCTNVRRSCAKSTFGDFNHQLLVAHREAMLMLWMAPARNGESNA